MAQSTIPAWITDTCVISMASAVFTGPGTCTAMGYTPTYFTVVPTEPAQTPTLVHTTAFPSVQTWNHTFS